MASDQWGMPDHTRPLTHSPPNPTPPYVPPPMDGGGGGWGAPSGGFSGPVSGGGAGAAPDGVGYVGPVGPSRKSLWLAIPLTLFLGPFGLFYIGILSGIAGLIIVPWAVRTVALGAALSTGGGLGGVEFVGIATAWLICVPWAIAGVLLRNAKVDRLSR
jgi:hypothetical protein